MQSRADIFIRKKVTEAGKRRVDRLGSLIFPEPITGPPAYGDTSYNVTPVIVTALAFSDLHAVYFIRDSVTSELVVSQNLLLNLTSLVP